MRKFIGVFLFGCLVFSNVAYSLDFPDVSTDHPNKTAIDYLSDEKIISGYPDGTFRPEDSISRSELMKVLTKRFVGEGPYSDAYYNCFPDVKDDWYAPYVCYASSQGWVDGYSSGLFEPKGNVSIAEAIKMLINSQGFGGEVNSLDFDDWYTPYLVVAKNNGFIDEADYYLFPENDMYRASITESLYRVLVGSGGGVDNCQFDPDVCSDDQFCIRDECVEGADVLPSNEELSEEYCNYDEVYIDGECEKAKASFMFVGEALEDEGEFDYWIDYSVAGFLKPSALEGCSDQIRVNRIFDFCLEEEINVAEYFLNTSGVEFDFLTRLHPYEVFDEKCLGLIGHMPLNSHYSTLTHEVGHGIFGLWDQYCYLPNSLNPNPVDFDEGQCGEPEDEWFAQYCAYDPGGAQYEHPYQCMGMPNSFGGISVMGSGSWIESPGFGFSQPELDVIEEILSCD